MGEKLTESERITILMIRGFGDRQRSYDQVREVFNENFPDRNPISKDAVSLTVRRFSEHGTVQDSPRCGRPLLQLPQRRRRKYF